VETNDLRKAAEQALEALENIDRWLPTIGQKGLRDYEADAIQALRQALAQTEKPPVKTYCGGKPNYCAPEVTPEVTGEVTEEAGACVTCGAPKSEWLVDAVNISAERVDETAKREQEPVECMCGLCKLGKREWVGLTDEEIYDYADKFLYQHGSNYGIKSFGKAIEAKLKEKNGG